MEKRWSNTLKSYLLSLKNESYPSLGNSNMMGVKGNKFFSCWGRYLDIKSFDWNKKKELKWNSENSVEFQMKIEIINHDGI